MGFLNIPNLPEKPVKYVIIDGRTDGGREKRLNELGIKVIKTNRYEGLYEAISYHPDIMLFHVEEENIVYAPGTDYEMLTILHGLGLNLIRGDTVLHYGYPGNIAYNVARIGNLAFHNTHYTDAVVKKELDKRGVELVHINQGYSKCSMSIVNGRSIITEDPGIARQADKKGLDILLIEPEKNILLPGLSNGFIGGCSGLIDSNRWAITGNIEMLDSACQIYDFLKEKNVEIVMLSTGPVIDIGSIIAISY